MAPLGRSTPSQLLRVFAIAFVVYAYFMPRWADWNIDSRFDLVRAIVDRHTLRIDEFHWNTWDKAEVGGHFYSDKAPGTALLGAGVYAGFAAARQLPISGGAISLLEQNDAWKVPISIGRASTQNAPAPRGTTLGGCQRAGVRGNVQYIPWGNRLVPPFRDWALSKYVVTVGVDALLAAAFLVFFFWFLGFFTGSLLARSALTLLLGAATDGMPYSTVLYSHQLAASFLFTGFALIFLRSRGVLGWWASAVAGFLLGFALFTEYTVLLIVVVVAAYGVWRYRRHNRDLSALAVCAAVPALGLLAYNWACFGGPLDTGYSHDFCWSAAQAAGFAGFTYPHLGPLFDLTFGSYRGLFYLSPFLLLAVPGAVTMARVRLPLEAAVCVVCALVLILAISAYWGWNGGRVEGPRYLVPVIPFLAFPVLWFLTGLKHHGLRWAVVLGAGAWSLFAVWTQFLGGPLFPISWLRNPIFDYSLPALGRNDIAPNAGFFFGLRGWESLLPLVIVVATMALLRRPGRMKPARPAMEPVLGGGPAPGRGGTRPT